MSLDKVRLRPRYSRARRRPGAHSDKPGDRMSAVMNDPLAPSSEPGLLVKERTIAGIGFNRWLVPPAALAIHLCIGMAYGFSVFWLRRWFLPCRRQKRSPACACDPTCPASRIRAPRSRTPPPSPDAWASPCAREASARPSPGKRRPHRPDLSTALPGQPPQWSSKRGTMPPPSSRSRRNRSESFSNRSRSTSFWVRANCSRRTEAAADCSDAA